MKQIELAILAGLGRLLRHEDGAWSALATWERESGRVWTGVRYRDLTEQEKREGRTAEPTETPPLGDQVP